MTWETRRQNFVEQAMSAPTDILMHSLGFVEILPTETDRVSDIRWSAYKVRTALRLGPKGSFIFDPNHELPTSAIDADIITDFEINLRNLMDKKKANLCPLFPKVDPIIIEGIEKRLANDKSRKAYIRDALNSTDKDERLRSAFALIQKSDFQKENGKEGKKTDILIVAHTNTPDSTNIIQKVSGKYDLFTSPKIKDRVAGAINVALMTTMTPYLGAAVLGAELESTGKVGNISILDFDDINYDNVDDSLGKFKPKIALISGILSIDIRTLGQTTNLLQKKGIRTLVGGLAATIDPNAVVATTNTDVFIGEAEGAMDLVLNILENATDDERFVFHREARNGSAPNLIEIVDDSVNNHIKHVYLGLDPLVNINQHYSKKNEESGQLASRLRFESMMQPKINAFGKKWDIPSWVLKQISIKVGCPHGCLFCSTVESQGTDIREKPLDSVELEIMATEPRSIIVVDQNLGGINKKEDINIWANNFECLLKIFKKYNKRLACQTELATWDRVNQFPNLCNLVSRVMIAALGGIEQPAVTKLTERNIPGNSLKIPTDYPRQVAIMRKLGIISVVTAIAGNIENTQSEKENIPLATWEKFVKTVNPDILAVFPLVKNPGSPGIKKTSIGEAAPLESYLSASMTSEKDWQNAFEIEALNHSGYLQTVISLLRKKHFKRALVLTLLGAAQKTAHDIKIHPIKLMREIR